MKSASCTHVSLVTNVCSIDAPRIRMVLPHWLRVFGGCLAELVVVVDPTLPSGRISRLHGSKGSLEEVRETLDELKRSDFRIRVIDMPTGTDLANILKKWFRSGRPIRCGAGTPIAAFIAAIEAASEQIVFRADCDMLFYNAGWLRKGIDELTIGRLDLLEPCNLSANDCGPVSMRAVMLNQQRFEERLLPMKAFRMDILRRFKASWEGRSPWLPLEQMLEKERQGGRLRFVRLPLEYGHSLHVVTRDDAGLEIIPKVVAGVEAGLVPNSQLASGENFVASAWRDFDGVDL